MQTDPLNIPRVTTRRRLLLVAAGAAAAKAVVLAAFADHPWAPGLIK
jgi:hypothetical protein